MFWKRLPFLLAACVLLARPASAQLGGQDLPDLSGLAGAIANSVKAPPADAAPAKKPALGTVYHSGLVVPSVHPGETARGIGRQLRESVEKQKGPSPALQKLEDAMPATLASFEDYMEKHGVAKRDMGVAMGVFITENWETATSQDLSDAAAAHVVQVFGVVTAKQYKARYAALAPEVKEKQYETLLMSPMLLSTLSKAFDKAGKTQEAATMRGAAASAFTKLTGMQPSQMEISADGRTINIKPKVKAPADASPSDVPPADVPPADAPHAARPREGDAPQAASGASLKPSQIAGLYTEQVMQMGVGGFFTQVFKPLLALKDGTFCEYLDVPPSEFDVADSRRRYPDRWGRWRTNASSTSTRWDGSAQHIQTLSKKGVWETAEWIGPLSGGGPGQRLSGTYTNTGGGGNVAYGGDMAVIQQSFYSFSPAGRFRCGRSIGGTTDTGTIASKRTTGGTYTLGGYAITLRFDDGTARRCLYARVKDGMIFMQDEAYVTGNDK